MHYMYIIRYRIIVQLFAQYVLDSLDNLMMKRTRRVDVIIASYQQMILWRNIFRYVQCWLIVPKFVVSNEYDELKFLLKPVIEPPSIMCREKRDHLYSPRSFHHQVTNRILIRVLLVFSNEMNTNADGNAHARNFLYDMRDERCAYKFLI